MKTEYTLGQIIQFPDLKRNEKDFEMVIVRIAYALAGMDMDEITDIVELIEMFSQHDERVALT